MKLLQSLPTLPTLPIGRGLGAALALLLLLMGLGTALSSRQSQEQLQTLALLEQTALPSARLLHELIGQVDELRGLLALHLMLGGTPEASALAPQMRLRRQAIEQRLAAFGPRLVDGTERTHFDAVSASLAVFLAEQDKLLAITRRGTQDAATAAAARTQLTGPSQLAYQRLSADLAAWSAYVEQRSDQAQRQARAGLASLPWLGAVQALLLLAAATVAALQLAAGRWPVAGGGAAAGVAQATDRWADWPRRRRLVDLADTVDKLAFEAHLQAVNAAVVAARQGVPGAVVPAGQEEGLRHLARRVADTTQALRQLLAGEPLPAGPAARLPAAAGAPAPSTTASAERPAVPTA